MTNSALETLRQLGLTDTNALGHYVLELVEHESRKCSLTEPKADTTFAEVSELLAEAKHLKLLTIDARRDSNGLTVIVVKASSMVGFSTSSSGSGEKIFVRVKPKVGNSRMIELAVLARMLPAWKHGGAKISPSIEEALLEWTISAFNDEVRHLLAHGGLRSTHERIRSELKNRMRGRLLPGLWLRNVANGKPNLIPSEFPSLELDNSANRLLRWALHVSVAAAHSLARGPQIVQGLLQTDKKFAGISLAKPRLPILGSSGLPANLRHYTTAIALAKYVIDSVRLGIRPGEVEAMSIAIDMNEVYERAFYHALRVHQPLARRHESWGVKFSALIPTGATGKEERSTKMFPDVWIDGDARRMPIVVDTKWKNVLHTATTDTADLLSLNETDTIKLRSEDIYQATAYAVEALQRRVSAGLAINGCVAALVYPTVKTIPDFGREINLGAIRIIIRFIGWNVNEPPLLETGLIWERLSQSAVG